MKADITERTFTIEITVTEKEVDFLQNELHKVYKAFKDDKDYDIDDFEVRRERLSLLRDFRNTFANILHTYYMGEDA